MRPGRRRDRQHAVPDVLRPIRRHCLLLMVATVFLQGRAQSDTVTLIPFGSAGIRYATFPLTYTQLLQTYPNIAQPGFDDSMWGVGVAPFGCDGAACSVGAATYWGLPDRTAVARVWVNLPPGTTALQIERRRCGSTYIWLNGGGPSGWVNCEGWPSCPWATCIGNPTTPQYFVIGLNLITVVNENHLAADWSYMDFEITADVDSLTVGVPEGGRLGWGGIKTLFR